MNWFNNTLFSYLYFWGLKDLLEILLFVTILYKTTAWLNQDRTRKLVWYLYGYCTLIFIAYATSLSFIFSLLIQASPVIAIIALLMHQDMLQKRFAMPTKIVPAHVSTQWIDELLQASLIAMNSNKQLIYIIEHQDSVQNLLSTSYQLNTSCKKNILSLLIESSLFEQQKFIYMSCDGSIKGINCTWLDLPDTTEKDIWFMATKISTKTDMLAFKAHAQRNTFDIVLHGNIIENLSSTHCRSVLLQCIHKTNKDSKNSMYIPNQKGKNNEKNIS